MSAQAQKQAEEKVLDALVGNKASIATRESFRKRLRNGDLDDNEIEIAVNETDNQGGIEIPIINVREDPLSTPGAKFLLGLTVIAGISVIGAGVSIIRRPKTKAEEKLIDDSGYSFDEADVQKAILSGTRFDESSEDTRQWTEGKDDGKRQIRVKGPDAEKFTDYVITRDASKISSMRARYVILCNAYGGVLNDPILLRISEDEFWFSLSDARSILDTMVYFSFFFSDEITSIFGSE